MSTCKHPGCELPAATGKTGYCSAHYTRWRKGRDMDEPVRPRVSAARAAELLPQARELRAQGMWHTEIAEQLEAPVTWVQTNLKGMEAGPRPKTIPHGTPSAWSWHKCTCEICTQAKREYKAAEYQRRMERSRITHPHGTAEAYRQGCTCRACKAAAAAELRARNHATRPTATRHGMEWTGADAETAFRTDITITERARILGRTYAAVDDFIRHYRKRGDDPYGVL